MYLVGYHAEDHILTLMCICPYKIRILHSVSNVHVSKQYLQDYMFWCIVHLLQNSKRFIAYIVVINECMHMKFDKIPARTCSLTLSAH